MSSAVESPRHHSDGFVRGPHHHLGGTRDPHDPAVHRVPYPHVVGGNPGGINHTATKLAEQDYLSRLSLEAAEALAAAATMSRSASDAHSDRVAEVTVRSGDSRPESISSTTSSSASIRRASMDRDDALALEAAETLSDVASLQRLSDERRPHSMPVRGEPRVAFRPPPEPRRPFPAAPAPDLDLDARPPPPPGAQTSSPPPHRGKYRCGRCGQMKVNHVCPLGQQPLQRSMGSQTEPLLAPVTPYGSGAPAARPLGPRDRFLAVRRWDPKKRNYYEAAVL